MNGRLHERAGAFLALALLDGCAGARQTTVALMRTPTVTAEQLTALSGRLVIGPLSLVRDGVTLVRLGADGSLEVEDDGPRARGRLEPDGRYLDASGTVLATLGDDGEITMRDGRVLPLRLEEDGSLRVLADGRVLRLGDDGTVLGGNPAVPAVRVVGLRLATRRTAMLLLVLAAWPDSRTSP